MQKHRETGNCIHRPRAHMNPIRDFSTQELVWLQPHATQRAFELRTGEEVLGSLRWYLMVLRSDDEASVSASTAVICSAT